MLRRSPPPDIRCRFDPKRKGRCGPCRKLLGGSTRRLAFVDEGPRDFWLVWPKSPLPEDFKRTPALICRTLVGKQTPAQRVGLLLHEIPPEMADAAGSDFMLLERVLRVAKLCVTNGMEWCPASICEVRAWLDGHGDDWLSLQATREWALLNRAAAKATKRSWTGWR